MMQVFGLAVAAAITSVVPAEAPPDAQHWLLQSSAAAEHATYQGVAIFRGEHTIEALHVAHRFKDGQVQERLTSLSGTPSDVSGPASLFPRITPDLLARVAAVYEVRDAGTARVAGRPCRGVLLAPRDDFRYGYEVCADAETAVPLEVSLLDHAGRTVEQLMFTEVSFPARLDERLFERVAVAALPAPEPPVAAVPSAQVVRLPPGYRIVSRQLAPGGERWLLSDGVSAVAVYWVRTAPESTFHGASSLGAMNAYARHVGAVHITVIGEVPAQTVRLIGDGLAPDEPPAAEK